MKKIIKFFSKTIITLISIVATLFVVYITNADSKLVEIVYDFLIKYHTNKKVEDKV